MKYDVGPMLLESRLITGEQMKSAELASQIGDFKRGIDPGDPLFKIVVLLGFAQPNAVATIVAKEMGAVAYVLIDGFPVDPHLVSGVKREFAEQYNVIPLVKDAKDTLLAAVSGPLDAGGVKYLNGALGVGDVQYLPVPPGIMPDLVAKVYDTVGQREVQGVRLGEILVREGLIPKDKLQRTIAQARAAGMPLGRYMVKTRMVKEDLLTKTLAGMADLPYVEPEEAMRLMRESSVKQRLKKEYVKFNLVLPYAVKNRVLYALTANPFVKTNELPNSYGCTRMEMSVIMESTFALLFSKVYGEEMSVDDAKMSSVKTAAEAPAAAEAAEGLSLSTDNEADIRARYEHLVNRTIIKAIEIGASDIHIENFDGFVQTRLRVDGVLHNVPDSGIDKETLRGVMNILKIEGNMNIAETRQPQGGSFRKISPDGSPYDFRVQIMPSVNGETAVIRLLPGKKRIPTLGEIGFPPRILEGFERAINNPSGLILMTGPTGSGKTTTLCSALAHVAQDPTCKVLTVEDPVEYQLPNVTQIETIPSKGVDFTAAARGFMRMDPDVILIGEIRDAETANEALKLAYSGHLTFSTLHTSSAVASVERMYGFGLDRLLLIEQMLAICSQRLVRRLCPYCREPYTPTEADARSVLYQGVPEGMRFFQAKGCERCHGLGHLGRTMLAEFLNFTGNTRATFRRETEQNLIYVQLLTKGLEPMIDDGFNKVHQGYIDVRWLLEVIPQDYLEMGPSSLINTSPDVPIFQPS